MGPRAPSVGELPACGEAGPARARGARGSENAGTSSETGVGIPRAESPRFPGEGSSPQGQPGPKARARAVADGRQVDIPAPRARVTDRRGDGPDGAGPGSGRPGPGKPGGRGRSSPARVPGQPAKRTSEAGRGGALEKPLGSAPAPVPKPTQVGWQSMPRRAGGPRSRNSAKWPRNLGIRGTTVL